MSDQTPPPPPPPSGAGPDQPPAPGYWKASDGNWYPPQQQPPQQPAQFSPVAPVQSSSGMPGWAVGCLVAFGVVAFLGILAVGCVAVVADQAAEELDEVIEEEFNNAGEAADVTLVGCGVDELGNLNADVRVTNNSSERSNYFIDVAFDSSSGDQLETSFVTVSALEPGQSTTQPAVTFTALPDATEVSCRVADVERLSDE